MTAAPLDNITRRMEHTFRGRVTGTDGSTEIFKGLRRSQARPQKSRSLQGCCFLRLEKVNVGQWQALEDCFGDFTSSQPVSKLPNEFMTPSRNEGSILIASYSLSKLRLYCLYKVISRVRTTPSSYILSDPDIV